MKLWKSPVFYFGILLVIAVAGLLAAPFVIDWNGYRADLEAYGRKLTGREVRIGGDIAARLFPWPRLTADDVHLANLPGLEEKEFATAARIVVRMSLAGLFKGNFDVESIDIEKPTVTAERLASGEINWQLAPAGDQSLDELLDRVKLDRITLSNGTLRFIDRRRGETHELSQINAAIAAPGLAGPWRVRAVGLYQERAVEVGLNTAAWKASEPFRFGLRAAAADGTGPVFVFDGSEDAGKLAGEFRIEPAAAADGKGDAEGEFRPLVLRSQIAADFDAIEFQKIEIAPPDPKDGGTLLSGTARLGLGRFISAEADLSASMLDVDELAGAEARHLLRSGGGLALADGLLALLPRDVNLSGALKVAALKAGGETLNSVVLRMDAAHDAIRVKELSASLPGHSRALFSGVFFPGKAGAELAGSLAVESADARYLAGWAWPEGHDAIAAYWTGSRGRFKLQTDISMTPSRLRLSKTEFELDGERGSGEFSFTAGGRGMADVLIKMGRIDLDNFTGGAVPGLTLSGAEHLLRLAVPDDQAPDLRLMVQTGELLFNGVTASNVGLDLAAGSNGLDLRTLEIGSVGGARLNATGLILDNGAGPDGSIGVEVRAEDPRQVLRLAGLIGDAAPAWATALGATAFKGTFTVKSRDGQSETAIDATATAGSLTATLTGQVKGAETPDRLAISGTADLATTTSGRLAALAGLRPRGDDTQPGRLTLTVSGTPRDGFASDLQLQAYGARLDYNGHANPAEPGYGLAGKLAVRSTDAAALAEPLGLPVAQLPAGPLVLDAELSTRDGATVLPGIGGRLGGEPLSGTLTFDHKGRIAGDFHTGGLALNDLLAVLFLDWSGAPADMESSLVPGLPFGLQGEVWLRPAWLAVYGQFTAREVQVGITAEPGELRLAMFGKDDASRDAHIEIAAKGEEGSRRIEGRIALPVDLGRQLRLAGGAAVTEGQGTVQVEFQADGRTPGGALAQLRGTGSYDFGGVKLLGLSPASFTSLLASAKDNAGLTAAFDALRGGEGLAIGRAVGHLNVANGVVNFQPVTLSTAEADIDVKAVGELAQAALDIAIGLKLKARAGLPPMTIAYAGPPLALARSEDNAELATSLGVTLMRQGVDELERLQKEQERLAVEEEKQKREDEARLASYYAQRDELLLRKRELKVHAEMRMVEAERLRQKLEAERAANLEINKSELKQRQREIRIYRRLARLQRASSAPEPAPPVPSKPQRSVTKPVQPVILTDPQEAPVVVSPPPSASPSQ